MDILKGGNFSCMVSIMDRILFLDWLKKRGVLVAAICCRCI